MVSFFGSIRYAPELDGALDYAVEPRVRWVRPIFLDEACKAQHSYYKK